MLSIKRGLCFVFTIMNCVVILLSIISVFGDLLIMMAGVVREKEEIVVI